MPENLTDKGTLKAVVTTINNIPIDNVKVSIYIQGEPENKIEELTTDTTGNTEIVTLDAPPIELSLNEENIIQPYASYNILFEAEGFNPVMVSGTEILSGEQAIQQIKLTPGNTGDDYVIPAHTLY